MNDELNAVLARAKEMLDRETGPVIAYLQLHPDRVEDIRRSYGGGSGASAPPMWLAAGIEILASVYLPKNRGVALDHDRKPLGAVLMDSTDPATWQVLIPSKR